MGFVAKDRGFALITALLLMGFLMTLIVGVSVLLRIDFQLQDKVLGIKQAKANARIGLQIGLGELQEKMGPDLNWVMPEDAQGEIVGNEGKVEGRYAYAFDPVANGLGVLSNAAEGGLKQDLTSYLTEGKGLRDSDRIVKDLKFSPRWAIIKHFYQLSRNNTGKSIQPVGVPQNELLDRKHKEIVNEVVDPVTKTHGIGPIILGIKFGLRPNLERDFNAGFTREMKVQYFLSLELWNLYAYDLSVEEYVFEVSSRGVYDNIIYLNEDKQCFLNTDRSLIHKTNNAFFRGIINTGFKAGEVKIFSISFNEDSINIKDGNLLIENGSIFKFVNRVISSPIQGGGRQEYSELNKELEVKEVSRMRGGGQAPPRVNAFLKQERDEVHNTRNVSEIVSIRWGGEVSPRLTFVLALKRNPSLIFQEIKELKVDNWRVVNKPDIVNNKLSIPLFAVVFENRVTKESLQKYNLRSQCIWMDDDNIIKIKEDSFPYSSQFWVNDASNNYEKLFKIRSKIEGVKLFNLPSDFYSLSSLRYCNLGLHENGPSYVVGNSYKNVFIPTNIDKSSVSYLYDSAYHINKALWDSYFLFTESERSGKRFFKLKDGRGLLGRGVLNVNLSLTQAWAEALTELIEPSYSLKKGQVMQLATEIVNQVKVKGSFKTLGDFVNRPLGGECGVLQVALDKVGIPLNQYDVLDLIGDQLVVRSDIFVIRAYGEAVNPGTRKKLGLAVCEAVVQRVPEYIEASQNKSWDEPGELIQINKELGRRFKIVSFRWLKGEQGEVTLKRSR